MNIVNSARALAFRAAAATLAAATCPAVGAQGSTAPAGAVEVPIAQPAWPGALNHRRTMVTLPLPPHEAQPEARPYPDYFALALDKAGLAPPPAAELTLRTPAGATATPPPLAVLPVQTQAFGFAPAFRAVVGALLDAELDARAVSARRATDMADVDGVFARRLPDAAIEALRHAQAPAGVLALYLGHDGADSMFVSLQLRDGSPAQARERTVHRRVALPAQVRAAIDAMRPVLQSMLAELALGKNGAPRPASTASRCAQDTWALRDLDVGAPPLARACHAVVVASLLPVLSPPFTLHNASTDTPGRLAWLAEAWVQARRSEDGGPGTTARALQALAWEQLRLELQPEGQRAPIESDDPVVAPLVQLFAAPERAAKAPHRAVSETVQRLMVEAARGLPDTARTLFFERGHFRDPFRRVDLCAIERVMPGVMVRPECRTGTNSPKTGAPSAVLGSLHEHWRLAASYKDIDYFGKTQGQQVRLAQLLAALPSDVAAHPLVQQRRALTELSQSSQGGAQEHLGRVRAAVQDFVASTAAMQRYDMTLATHSLSEHTWTRDASVLGDAQVQKSIDAERRLIHVLGFDRFASGELPPLRRRAGMPAAFLGAGLMHQLASHGALPPAAPAAASAAVPPAPDAGARSLFGSRASAPIHPPTPTTVEQWRARVAEQPADMRSRVALATLLLQTGRPIAEARALIDAHPSDGRIEWRVAESHAWAEAGHLFFLAGEFDVARAYFPRVVALRTGSESDLHARVRLAVIEGDMGAAVAAAHDRLSRYEGDFARLELAALSFGRGDIRTGWSALQPRLASADSVWMWVGALSGHRVERQSAQAVRDWLAAAPLRGARMQHLPVAPLYAHLAAVIDRLPTPQDIAQFQGPRPGPYDGFLNAQWAASATLVRMALLKDFDRASFDALRRQLAQASPEDNKFLQPMFVWAAWQTTGGSDAEIAHVQATPLQSSDFDALLARSMVLALEGRIELSLDYLRAARWQMWRPRERHQIGRPLPKAHQYALSTWLMWQRTGQAAYRAELRRFVVGYQRVMPSEGWPAALQALTETDEKARAAAICRARTLDAESYFLSLVPASALRHATACPRSAW